MPYAIGPVPSLSGHAITYRWRSLPRVRRHRASKPQRSSERVLPSRQVTMDQLICASLSHTHHWYQVGMLKVPHVEHLRMKRRVYFFDRMTTFFCNAVKHWVAKKKSLAAPPPSPRTLLVRKKLNNVREKKIKTMAHTTKRTKEQMAREVIT